MSRRKLRLADGIAALLVVGLVLFVTVGPLSDHPPPSHSQYVAKADKVCTAVENKQAHLDNTIFKGIPFNQAPPPSLYVKYVKALIPTYTDQLNRLRKLTPAKGDEAKLQRYFAATERAVALLEEVAKDPRKVPLLTEKSAVFTAADKAARAVDLMSCGHAED